MQSIVFNNKVRGRDLYQGLDNESSTGTSQSLEMDSAARRASSRAFNPTSTYGPPSSNRARREEEGDPDAPLLVEHTVQVPSVVEGTEGKLVVPKAPSQP